MGWRSVLLITPWLSFLSRRCNSKLQCLTSEGGWQIENFGNELHKFSIFHRFEYGKKSRCLFWSGGILFQLETSTFRHEKVSQFENLRIPINLSNNGVDLSVLFLVLSVLLCLFRCFFFHNRMVPCMFVTLFFVRYVWRRWRHFQYRPELYGWIFILFDIVGLIFPILWVKFTAGDTKHGNCICAKIEDVLDRGWLRSTFTVNFEDCV